MGGPSDFLNIKPRGWGMKTEDKNQIHETLAIKDLETEKQNHELEKTKKKNPKPIRVTTREIELLKPKSENRCASFGLRI
jgi:hypothetical protein